MQRVGDGGGWWRRGAASFPQAARYAPLAAGLLLALVAVAESVLQGASATQPFLGESVSAPAGDPAGQAEGPPGTAATHGPGSAAATGGPMPLPTDGPVPGATDGPFYAMVFPLLALATTLPLPLLWAQPLVAAVLVSAAGVLSIAAFHTLTAAGVAAQLIASYRCGRHGSPIPAVLMTVPFPVVAAVLESAGWPDGKLRLLTVLPACLAPAAALAGIARRARGKALADTAARQVVADSLLEHVARGERARIARELHDVVAHHISMVAVQAETARLAVPGMPAAGAERLLAIGDTARAALTEMRRLLGVLREDAEAEATWRPQPGLRLHELNELLDESREASGSSTRLILRGAPVELDPGVELAAYRIIQEALTNARRHAPGAAVDVELHYTDDALRLAVRDNGPGPAAEETAGHGLSGMRERAAAVGGELRTGPAPGGGFLVEARLPGKDTDTA
ncbi:sensor histidine kinase [Nonomuraea sp. SYSU D8015]|uniref:sensor histidine kinase n=1 Tax=Nonomuraea sp. SYSU D8015 TaxID=2593644 RepID=UPI001CB7241F|nr:sensor histidine kinase [Nonomuraea sp. SYSU D8015]